LCDYKDKTSTKLPESVTFGATENAGLENDGPSKSRGCKIQDWNLADQIAGLEYAGLEKCTLQGSKYCLYKNV